MILLRLVRPDMLLQPVWTPEVQLHYASSESEPHLIRLSAYEWLKRFDVSPEQALAYKARLLVERKILATSAESSQPSGCSGPGSRPR